MADHLLKGLVEEFTKLSKAVGPETQKKLFIHTLGAVGFGTFIGCLIARENTLYKIYSKN